MTKYEKGMIYKLVKKDDFDNNNIYIGSTCNIIKRRYYHKAACLNENNSRYNMKLYIFIRENGGWDNWIITPVESYPCNNKRELEIRERYYIEVQLISPFEAWKNYGMISGMCRMTPKHLLTEYGDEVIRQLLIESYKKAILYKNYVLLDGAVVVRFR